MYENILSSLRTYILEAGYNTFNKKWQLLEKNKYPFTRLYCFKNGRAMMTHSGKKYILKPGYLYLVPVFAEVSWINKGGFSVFWCLFNATVLEGLDLLNCLRLPYQIKITNQRFIFDCFHN